MATSTVPISPSDLAEVRDLYDGQAAEHELLDVDRFLVLHPQVVPLLIEARPLLAEHFGPETPVRLEVVVDPESDAEDGQAQLFAMVLTGLEPEEARPLLRRFDHEWWLPRLRQSDGRLAFGIWYL